MILTILLDCKNSKDPIHLAIENESGTSDPKEEKLRKYLFGGNKSYQWLKSFMSLLQSISYTKKIPVKNGLIMIQYRLKLLTVLSNLLITHLLEFNETETYNFVLHLIRYLDGSISKGLAHKEIKDKIPRGSNEGDVEGMVLPYGFTLL